MRENTLKSKLKGLVSGRHWHSDSTTSASCIMYSDNTLNEPLNVTQVTRGITTNMNERIVIKLKFSWAKGIRRINCGNRCTMKNQQASIFVIWKLRLSKFCTNFDHFSSGQQETNLGFETQLYPNINCNMRYIILYCMIKKKS